MAVALVVLCLAAWLVSRSADDLREAADRVGAGAFVLSGVLGLAGTLAVGQVWLALLRGMGVDAPAAEARSLFFVTQLGKYLPGSVWPVLAQMEFGRREGAASRRVMLAVNVLLLALVTATGLVVGAGLLPWSSSGGLERYWWALLLLVPLLVLHHPRVIPALLDRGLALLGREPLGLRLTWRSVAVAAGWCVVLWLTMGWHLLVMTRALGAEGVAGWAAATGGMALGWAAGLIVLPAPAGAGVREAVLVATFTPQVGLAPALAVALASRVLLLLADVVLATVGAAYRLRGGAARSGRGKGASG